jgi:ubiquinone/menaquinone biosynthesis C-methylase UbiE
MNFLKILWQHLFQQKNTSSEQEEAFSGLTTDFSAEPLSGEMVMELMQEAGFEQTKYYNLTGGIVALHRGYKF